MVFSDFLAGGTFAFLLTFMRVGSAFLFIPGFGDSFVPTQIRLLIALGLSLSLAPVIAPYIPAPLPDLATMLALIVTEFIIGLFIGTVARMLMIALDVAGMIISMSSGLSNAQVFNPALSTQGSIVGAFFSITGLMLLFSSNLHHLLIYSVAESYDMFPVGSVPDTADMADLMSSAITAAFMTGFQIAIPFLIISILLYTGMGVLNRLMPQVQVFILALPVQILLALLTLALVLSSAMMFWLGRFQDGMTFFLNVAGG